MLRYAIVVVCVCAVLSSSPAPAGAAVYDLTDLGALAFPGGAENCQANGINSSGQVVGSYTNSSGLTCAFLYSGGSMINIGNLGAGYSGAAVATAINSSGQIVGYASGPQPDLAFLYSNGTMAPVGNIQSLGVPSQALGINDSGEVVGTCFGAFIYTGSNLAGEGGGAGAATSINDSGVFVGRNNGSAFIAVYYGSITYPFPGGTSEAMSINASGQVVGVYSPTAGVSQAFFLGGDGPTDTGTLPGFAYSQLDSVNAGGQAVGWNSNSLSPTSAMVASLYSGGAWSNLNAAVINAPAGWTLEEATGINDNGWIVGYGINPSGVQDAFLLTPVPRLPGDANADGTVDVNDLTIVLSNFGTTGTTWSQGEFTGDGTVDVNDLTIVLTNFGKTLGTRIKAVPEPSALALAAAGLAVALAACARRKRR